MASPPSSPWEDRRGMFQRGKEVHEPGRKNSTSGLIGGTGSAIMDTIRRTSTASIGGTSLVDKPLTNDPESPTAQRRRSSAASAGKFGSLHQHKRGSEDYAARRASQNEGMAAGGVMSGWFNSTFRGIVKTVDPSQPAVGKPTKRGVME